MSSEVTCKVTLVAGNTRAGQRGSGHSAVSTPRYASGLRTGSHAVPGPGRGCRQTMRARGVRAPALKHQLTWEGLYPENGVQSRGQNRTREIRPSGIVGRLQETWLREPD